MRAFWFSVLVMTLSGSLAIPCCQAQIGRGSQELGIGGMLDVDTPAGDILSLDLSYGYFVTDPVQLGPSFSYYSSDAHKTWQIGLFTEYNFHTGYTVLPYFGGELGYAGSDETPDSSAIVLDLAMGSKFFLVDSLALDLSLSQKFASGDVYARGNNEFGSMKTTLNLGLRYFF